jgi:hypothetical protein
MLRVSEDSTYYAIHPEYRAPAAQAPAERLGHEYTSENTERLTAYEELSSLIDAIGKVDYFI